MIKFLNNNYWPKPKSRDLGFPTDIRLFSETLLLAYTEHSITNIQLQNELSERVKGLKFIKQLSITSIDILIKEMKTFGWIKLIRINKSSGETYTLDFKGIEALEIYKSNKLNFLKLLIYNINKIYIIPAWFVNRLWELNKNGQGEIIIPLPIKEWLPKSREFNILVWNNILEEITFETYKRINNSNNNLLPIEYQIWRDEVKIAWERIINHSTNSISKRQNAPRLRLSLAMKEASIKILFSNCNPLTLKRDFKTEKPPLFPRTYAVWCPRLLALQLIMYTDSYSTLPGRLLFPVSVFKSNEKNGNNYLELPEIHNTSDEILYLHRPNWGEFKEKYVSVLYNEHQRQYLKVRSLYVSLLDVRDGVCRQLRISANTFEDFLELSVESSLKPDSKYRISLETDIREDQRRAYQISRRPVLIKGIPYSLIAITKT